MGADSKIEWTHHTFNPWLGCTAVSPACDHCYAEALVNGRLAGNFAERRRTAPSTWHQPMVWNRKAAAAGRRDRVFCASLADVFDNQVPAEWLADLLELIRLTPALDWLLLTKRPQNIGKRLQAAALSHSADMRAWVHEWLFSQPPGNVWLGTTVENQAEADRRIPHLLDVPARLHFLSCEPLLGPVALASARNGWNALIAPHVGGTRIGWVIAGGESGPKARPTHPDWLRGLRDQCVAAEVPFFFKQWGTFLPGEEVQGADAGDCIRFPDGEDNYLVGDGWDLACCTVQEHQGEPKRLWREYWASGDGRLLKKVGKKAAGAMLDGAEHREVPHG